MRKIFLCITYAEDMAPFIFLLEDIQKGFSLKSSTQVIYFHKNKICKKVSLVCYLAMFWILFITGLDLVKTQCEPKYYGKKIEALGCVPNVPIKLKIFAWDFLPFFQIQRKNEFCTARAPNVQNSKKKSSN